MNKVEIIDDREKGGPLEVGQIFIDETQDILYLLTVVEIYDGVLGYFLVSLDNGGRYGEPVEDINDVFCKDRKDFRKLKDGEQIKITIGAQ